MNSRIPLLLSALLIFFQNIQLYSQPSKQNNLSFITKIDTHVNEFLNTYPNADGRDVIILTLDTGIDPTVSGLQITSDGKPKLLDAMDLSNSETDIYFEKAIATIENNQTTYRHPTNPNIILQSKSPIIQNAWIGAFDESRLKNANISDFDDDDESHTLFGILLIRDKNESYIIIDIDNDKDITNDSVLKSYLKSKDIVRFKGRDKTLLFSTINIYPDIPKISLSYDDDSHGTHVAGIAAGYNVYGDSSKRTFDGVAPGARLVSIKISNSAMNNLSTTGSIKRGLDFAALLSTLQNMPVVANLSFGIDAEIEEQSDLENYIDNLLENYPKLYLCVSNGNSGPSISSTGQPASSRRAISVGAILTKDTSRDVFGIKKNQSVVWSFSSNGEEILKPDILAPGTATSTVPFYLYDPVSSGTSMASPYVAGSIALLLSALIQDDPEGMQSNFYSQHTIKRALKASASKLKSQGQNAAGVINVMAAYKLLKQYRAKNFNSPVFDILREKSIEEPASTSFASYKTLLELPEEEIFSVSPKFSSSTDLNDINKFFEIYTLESSFEWVKPIQKNIAIKGQGWKQIRVRYDKTKVKKKGFHTARIFAYPIRASKSEVAFEIPFSVINPYFFSPKEKNEVSILDQTIAEGQFERYFVAIPSHASALEVSLMSRTKSPIRIAIADPDGHIIKHFKIEKDGGERKKITISKPLISAGVYELCVYSETNEQISSPINFDLKLKLRLLDIKLSGIKKKRIQLDVINSSPEQLETDIFLNLEGYQRKRKLQISANQKVFRYPFFVRNMDKKIEFELSFSKKDFSKATDVGIMITNLSGKKVKTESFDNRRKSIHIFSDNKTDTLWIEVHFAFALPNQKSSVMLSVVEKHFVEKTAFEVKQDFPSTFPAFSLTEVDFYLKKNLFKLPAFYNYMVSISALKNGDYIFKKYLSINP